MKGIEQHLFFVQTSSFLSHLKQEKRPFEALLVIPLGS
jgi:hypothetical protein